MSINPNTIKSQDDTTGDELGRTMTLLRAIEQLEKTECELEKVEKQLEIAKSFIFRCANDIAGDWYVNSAKCVLQKIEELNK